jgi:hypothetical protein
MLRIDVKNVEYQVLTAASMKFRVFWDILPCSQIDVDQSKSFFLPKYALLKFCCVFLGLLMLPVLHRLCSIVCDGNCE